MRVSDRLSEIKKSLIMLIREGRAGNSFVIFENQETKKFVQLVFLGDELVCDVPLQELSKLEATTIKTIMGVEEMDESEGKIISYQCFFSTTELDKVARFVEKLFIEGFQLPIDYAITVKINK